MAALNSGSPPGSPGPEAPSPKARPQSRDEAFDARVHPLICAVVATTFRAPVPNESVLRRGDFIAPVLHEIHRVIVGQDYLVNRLLTEFVDTATVKSNDKQIRDCRGAIADALVTRHLFTAELEHVAQHRDLARAR